VNIRHQGDADLSLNFAELLRCLADRYGNPYDVTARCLQGPNLVDGGTHIPGVRLGHGLDRDGGVASYGNLAELEGPGFAPGKHPSTIEEQVKRVNNRLGWVNFKGLP